MRWVCVFSCVGVLACCSRTPRRGFVVTPLHGLRAREDVCVPVFDTLSLLFGCVLDAGVLRMMSLQCASNACL